MNKKHFFGEKSQYNCLAFLEEAKGKSNSFITIQVWALKNQIEKKLAAESCGFKSYEH